MKSTPSIEELARRKMDAEHRKHEGSVFDARGRLDENRAANLGDISLGEYLHLDSIPWPPAPDGADHAQHLARLTEYMAQLPPNLGGVGPFDVHDQKVLHAVAMLYAIGKGSMTLTLGERPLGEEGYEERSAKFAEQFFHDGGGLRTYWSKPEVREDVCRLIYRHNDKRAIADDRRLQVFSDARRYELTRINPNTAEGIALLQRECAVDKFYLGWSKDKANFRGYMRSRGWR